MGSLFLTMLATSAVDSLNPIGIAQQFVLQGVVKKPRHIWYFIITTAVVNMIFGYMVYYGIITLIDSVFSKIMSEISTYLYIGELVAGIILFGFGIYKLIKRKNNPSAEEKEENKKPVSVTPLALIGIGIVSTASELTSALPYFTFLAVLINYRLSFPFLTLILILYNMVYIAPFVILFIIYLISKQKFDAVYNFFRRLFSKLSAFLIPALLIIVGCVISYHAITNLLS